jgi:hypothetical protein
MLDMHPDLFVLREMDEFQRLPRLIGRQMTDKGAVKRLIAAFPRNYNRHFNLVYFEKLVNDNLPATPADILRFLKGSARVALENPGVRWGHKEPHEWPYVYALRQWYPSAQFLHIVRCPHDVVGSVIHYESIGVGLHHVPTTPIRSAWHWRESVRSVVAQGQYMDDTQYTRLRYEDLVANPETMLTAVTRFLEADPAAVPEMMEFHQKALPGHKKAHMQQARHSVSAVAGAGRGERSLSPAALRDIDWICRREMAMLGYKPFDTTPPSLLRRLRLEIECAVYSLAWRALRLYRRLRGSL